MSLFITKRIQEKAAEFYLDLDEINTYGLYENPAPQGFVNINRQYNKSPKEVLIVSNHPPKEIQRAKKYYPKKVSGLYHTVRARKNIISSIQA